MELQSLYDIAEREHIHMLNAKIKDCKGMYCSSGKINAIALDYSQLDTNAEEKCVLAEELGHYYCNATYPLSCTDKELIDKAEYRAKKWSVKALVTVSDLKKVKLLGLKYKWEIAEFLNVTEDIIERAFNLYGGIQ